MRVRLRFLSSAVPLAGLAMLYLARLALLRVWPVVAVDAARGLLLAVGVLAFSWAIFRVIARQDDALARQHAGFMPCYETQCRLRAQLEALHRVALAVASAQTPTQILQRLVDLASELIGARYAALGVLRPQGAIDDFYTAGISDEERARIGPLPQGHGLLGVTLTEGATLRIPDIIRIRLVDDHEVVRQGLRSLLERREHLRVVAEAGTVAEAVAEAARVQPDVIVMDVRLPDGTGIEACRDMRAGRPQTRVLMLTSYADDVAVYASIVAGAAGYLLKQTRGRELVSAIEAVARGDSLLDPAVTSKVLTRMRNLAPGAHKDRLAE
jgi:DNA-binding NarL/FixJ family response regulator